LQPLDSSLQSFRIAGRELFNTYFRPKATGFDDAWAWEARFSLVEAELFEQLIAVPHELNLRRYGEFQEHIAVALRQGEFAPIMVNRDVDSGYWDYPLRELTREVELRFVRFFDWDLLAVRDSQFVRVVISAWPSHSEAVGKHALVEAQHVSYSEA
jgi:hypothetical protein